MMKQNGTILLVEDNPDDEKLAVRALKLGQVANPIVVARDGVEALDYLFGTGPYAGRNRAERPRVVLLDLKLPRVDGFEVLRRIREDEALRRVPVVILTSSKEDQDVLRSYNLYANSYIRKPVDFEQFAQVIKELKLYWLLINEPAPG